MRNILIIEDSSALGGVQHSTINFLKEAVHDPSIYPVVLIAGEGALNDICKALSVEHYSYHVPKPISTTFQLPGTVINVPNPLALLKHSRDSSIIRDSLLQVIIQHHISFDVIITKGMISHVPGALVGRATRRPVIWHVQDYITGRYWGIYRKLFGYLAGRHANLIIADGWPIVEVLGPKAKAKSVVVYNGVDTASFYKPAEKSHLKQQLGFKENDFVIGHVARIVPWKGQMVLVRAFHQVAIKYPQAKLLLIGSPLFGTKDYFLQIRDYIHMNDLENRVLLPGYLNDLTQVYAAMDVFVYPALEKDTCPLAILGALAAGPPIIASQIDGVAEVIKEAPDVHFYPKADENELARLMEMIIEREENCDNAAGNYEYAKQKFDNKIFYQNIKQLIFKVC